MHLQRAMQMQGSLCELWEDEEQSFEGGSRVPGKEDSNVVHDRSGFLKNGSFEGKRTQKPGKVGMSTEFNGSNYINCNAKLSPSPGFFASVISLVKIPEDVNSSDEIYGETIFMTLAHWQGCHYEGGYLVFWHFFTGRDKVEIRVPVATLLGQWTLIAWVLKENRLIAYVNGVKHTSSKFKEQSSINSCQNILIGGKYPTDGPQTPAPSFTSSVQHFALFPRALTATEVRALKDACQ